MINCLNCNNFFEQKWKNQKFCKTGCASSFNNKKRRVKPYNKCIVCNIETDNLKYCSRKCFSKDSFVPIYCITCDTKISDCWVEKKYCKTCYKNLPSNYRDWSKVMLADFFAELPRSQAHARIRSLSRALYKKSDKPKFCVKCGYEHFYEVCHIKDISLFESSASIAEINDINNLVALCPNHHFEFDKGLLTL